MASTQALQTSSYDGDRKNGRMEGHGKYTFPSGTIYTGQLRQQRWHLRGRSSRVLPPINIWDEELSTLLPLVANFEAWSILVPVSKLFFQGFHGAELTVAYQVNLYTYARKSLVWLRR